MEIEKTYKTGILQGLSIALKLLKKDKRIEEFYNYQIKLEEEIASLTKPNK